MVIDLWNGTWISAIRQGASPSGKTQVWRIEAMGGVTLGLVRWFGPWRKYAFYPASGTVYEEVCLRELAEFCAARTQNHRDGAPAH